MAVTPILRFRDFSSVLGDMNVAIAGVLDSLKFTKIQKSTILYRICGLLLAVQDPDGDPREVREVIRIVRNCAIQLLARAALREHHKPGDASSNGKTR